MATLLANMGPYGDLVFDSIRELDSGLLGVRVSPAWSGVRSVEFYGGSDRERDIWMALSQRSDTLSKAALGQFFEACDLAKDDQAAVCFLISNNGRTIRYALDNFQHVELFGGTVREYVGAMIDEFGEEFLAGQGERDVSPAALAREMAQAGEVVSFTFGGTKYVCTNASDT